MPITGKSRAIVAIILGALVLILPNIFIYAIALGLIAYGVNELFPDLKNQIRDYLRGSPTQGPYS